MPDTNDWLHAVRTSHERLTALLAPLTEDELERPSYDPDWNIAAVASHVGSQAEIFGLLLDAGLRGGAMPGGEVFGPIWDRWNALSPTEMAAQSIAANEALLARLDGLSARAADSFTLSMRGRDLDLTGFAGMRLSEHAVHTWDVAVALDATATVSPDAVDLLIDVLADTASWSGKPVVGAEPVALETSGPTRRFVVTLDPEVDMAPDPDGSGEALQIPAEALIRLVYGRLDPDHTPKGVTNDKRLAQLRTAFPGF